ncbi:MAG: hypothetical protein EZS28_015034, partial [Streblomastix strix]
MGEIQYLGNATDRTNLVKNGYVSAQIYNISLAGGSEQQNKDSISNSMGALQRLLGRFHDINSKLSKQIIKESNEQIEEEGGEDEMQACIYFKSIILKYGSLYNYQINLDDAIFEFNLDLLSDSLPVYEDQYPTQFAILGIEGTTLKLINSFLGLRTDSLFLQNLTLDLTNIRINIQTPKSLLELTNIKIIRNQGGSAVNE